MLPDSRTHKPVLALVPARGGSKSVKRKNMRLIGSKPLLGYTIEAARGSRYIDEVYLSSDDDEILDFGTSSGVRTVVRSSQFATDDATANDVVEHFMSTLGGELKAQDPIIVYLQPTSPLRTAAHIDHALEAMVAAGRTMLISVVELTKSPFKTYTLSGDGALQPLFDGRYANMNRQQLPPAFMPNGAIYVFPLSEFVRQRGFPSAGNHPYVMSAELSTDIDSEADLLDAERQLKSST